MFLHRKVLVVGQPYPIQSMITACKADIIGIDQYSLMDDETYRGKSKTEQLFSITEGLMRLSKDMIFNNLIIPIKRMAIFVKIMFKTIQT